MEAGGETPSLYTVLPEKTAAVGGALMGSSHVYDIGTSAGGALRKVQYMCSVVHYFSCVTTIYMYHNALCGLS